MMKKRIGVVMEYQDEKNDNSKFGRKVFGGISLK